MNQPTGEPDPAAARWQTYFDHLPGYVTVLDRDLRLLDANLAFRETFSGSASGSLRVSAPAVGSLTTDSAPLHCYEAFKGRRTPCPVCPVRETFDVGAPVQTEEILVPASGVEFPAAVYTAPVLDPSGVVTAVLKVSADISQVKRLQQRLHRVQRRYQRLFNEVPCYITVQDADLRLVAANRSFFEDFGDDLGARCYELYKHRSEPCLRCPVLRTFHDGRCHRSEEVVTSLGGQQYHVLVQTQPLRNEDGDVTQVLEISTNITELRDLQDQLSSLGLMVGSISHDLKGLLTAMDGGMYLVETGLDRGDSDRLEEGWEMVKRNIGRIRTMVLDILQYAKERPVLLVETDVTSFVQELHRLMEAKANALDIDFDVLVPPGGASFRVDESGLRSALINIVENAFDACRVDGKDVHHRVRFEVEIERDWVTFSIQDNGIGMDRESREHLFSVFYSTKGTEGTGLGLFISNQIVTAHGGRIQVTSALGQGTRFEVRVPREARREGLSPDAPKRSPGVPRGKPVDSGTGTCSGRSSI